MDVLYVPMTTEVFLCGNLQSDDMRISRAAPDYRSAFHNSFLGSVNTPEPFDLNTLPLSCGAHLHFILPQMFTHADEKNIYLSAPNRFHITRIAVTPDEKISCRRFVTESDFITDDYDGTDRSAIPVFSDGIYGSMFRCLGRSYPEGARPEEKGGYLEKLTALGPGDPAFAAYYPSCKSVFGFYDGMFDLPPNTKVTYCIIGCFSDAAADPFSEVTGKESFETALKKYGLSVTDSNRICNQMLVFAVVSGIVWKGKDYNYTMGIPPGEIDVSVGNTSSEALSAILRQKLADFSVNERYITALQYDLLDSVNEIDGNFKIDDEIHTQGFSVVENLSGGIDMPVEKNDTHNGLDYSNLLKKMELSGQAASALKDERRKLFCLWEQYMFLYEKNSSQKKSPSKDELKQEMQNVINKIKTISDTSDKLENDVKNDIEVLNKKQPEDMKCKVSGGESFYLPKEPVVLLSGNGIRRSFAFGESGRFTEDGTLYCQTETISSNIDNKKLLELLGGSPADFQAPVNLERYEKLLCQAALLSAEIKMFIEKKLGAITINGRWSPIMLSNEPQCFTTLFMDWSLRFYPTRTSDNGRPDNTLDSWKLEYGDMSYTTGKQRSAERNLIYKGRAIVTPHAAYNLKNILKKWLTNNPGDKRAQEAAEKAHELPVISQVLGGLNEQLCAVRHAFQFPVIGNSGDKDLAAEVEKYTAGEKISCTPSAELFTMRGGHFRIDRLNLLGTFGQIQQVVAPAGSGASMKKIHYAETIAANDNDYGLLTPGITSPLRLSFQWRHRADDTCISSPDSYTTSICGFLLPELLNRRLLVYANDGEYAGSLKTVYRKGAAQARWLSAPGLPAKAENLDIDTVLKKFILAMLGEDRLAGIMRLIDINFEKTLQPNAVTLIWGRPLALARASVQLLTQGSLAYTQSYEDFKKYNTQGVENVRFPLHFGDAFRVSDGMTAIFPDITGSDKKSKPDFDKIFTAWGIKSFNSGSVRFGVCPDISCTDGERFFTLLMETGNAVTLQTGILPVKTLHLPAEHARAAEKLNAAAELTCVLTTKGSAELPIMPPGKTGRYAWCVPGPNGEREIHDVVPVTANFGERYICDGMLIKTERNTNAK